MYIFLNITL